jgi:hypothetical protein
MFAKSDAASKSSPSVQPAATPTKNSALQPSSTPSKLQSSSPNDRTKTLTDEDKAKFSRMKKIGLDDDSVRHAMYKEEYGAVDVDKFLESLLVVTPQIRASVTAPAVVLASSSAEAVASNQDSPPAIHFANGGMSYVTAQSPTTGAGGNITSSASSNSPRTYANINFSPVFKKNVSVYTPEKSTNAHVSITRLNADELAASTNPYDERNDSSKFELSAAKKTYAAIGSVDKDEFKVISAESMNESSSSETLSQMNLLRMMMERIGQEELYSAERIRQKESTSMERVKKVEAESMVRLKKNEVEMNQKNNEYYLELVAGDDCLYSLYSRDDTNFTALYILQY